ncbi:type II secretion system protein [Pseudobacteroides cellulosolvens]|nr:type II secretion system protein [Pseudobacteroides cellulosolvens]
MKKMLKSKKGFSLIELLIVVAILAILAAISINLFGGVLGKQKEKSDKAACSYLQTAIQTYIAETDDVGLTDSEIKKDTVENLMDSFTKVITYTTDDGVDKKFGPYLNAKQAKLSQKDVWFEVAVDTDTGAVTVGLTKNATPANRIHVTAGAKLLYPISSAAAATST